MEPDNTLQDKTPELKNCHRQKIVDTEHFKVYDPKLHRPPKHKVPINQYTEHMKFKNNLFDNPQTEKNSASRDSINKNSREKTDSKIATDKYPEHIKIRSSSTDEKTASESSINKDMRDRFQFPGNSNLKISNKEYNKTFVKDVLNDSTPQTPRYLENPPYATKNDTKKNLKSLIIREGKEIADMIVSCQRQLEKFKSHYYEWIDFRKRSVSLLEQIVTIINQSPRKNDTMKQVIAAINIAADVAKVLPYPGVATGASVVRAVGGLFAKFYNRTDCKEEVNAKKFEIKEIFQRDIDSSSYVYIYGVQCDSQFKETCHTINKFHKLLLERNYQYVIGNEELLEFMNEITEYNITNTDVFYKRLRMCYERLIETSNSVDSRSFVRVFEDVPDAVSVIDLLPWKFDSDGFDNSIVQNAWDEIFNFFDDANLATVDTIKDKVQNCLFFLKKEYRILSRNVKVPTKR